jgi:lipoprotein-anchoring transpeptidase ErfK/SrfK
MRADATNQRVEPVMSAHSLPRRLCGIAVYAFLLTVPVAPAVAQALSYMPVDRYDQALPQYSPDAQGTDELPAALRRQVVALRTDEAPGTIIIDTAHTFLYLTLGDGKALRYGIGVGREGFTWSGVETIARKAEWPDWIPPAEMVARQPYLPRWVGGGPGNPLGARALYLGNTEYRIHGTNDPTTIGKRVSSGCIRLRNEDIIDLYNRVDVGTKVIVLPNGQRSASFDAGRAAPVIVPAKPATYVPQALTAPAHGVPSGLY